MPFSFSFENITDTSKLTKYCNLCLVQRSPVLMDQSVFVDDLNARNTSNYNYRNYKGDSSPVVDSAFRRYTLAVSSIDSALNVAPASSIANYTWIVGESTVHAVLLLRQLVVRLFCHCATD
jgi:hypothetical protein